jgi:hypothetical protein
LITEPKKRYITHFETCCWHCYNHKSAPNF